MSTIAMVYFTLKIEKDRVLRHQNWMLHHQELLGRWADIPNLKDSSFENN